ncbi:hypothetical protein JXA32_16250 [Candidatus Sumerlaeota bacterium]|nr:hypothetical protein [Candidatus Sumerlaeota bacterium]
MTHLWLHRCLPLLLAAFLAQPQALYAQTASPTAETSGTAKQAAGSATKPLRLNGVLNLLHPDTSTLVYWPDPVNFRQQYNARVISGARKLPGVEEFIRRARWPALVLSADFFPDLPVELLTCLPRTALAGCIPDEHGGYAWYAVFQIAAEQKEYSKCITDLFEPHPPGSKDVAEWCGAQEPDWLLLSQDQNALSVLRVLGAFPRTERAPSAAALAAREMQIHDWIYAAWHQMQGATQSADAFVGWKAHGEFASRGIQHELEWIESPDRPLSGLLEDGEGFSVFDYMPPEPLFAGAVRFSSAQSAYRHLMSGGAPLERWARPAADYILELERITKIRLENRVIRRLDGEWGFFVLPGPQRDSTWTLLAKVKNPPELLLELPSLARRFSNAKDYSLEGLNVQQFQYGRLTLHLAVAGDYLALSNFREGIDAVWNTMRGKENFSNSPALKQAMSRKQPGGAAYAFYQTEAILAHAAAQTSDVALHYFGPSRGWDISPEQRAPDGKISVRAEDVYSSFSLIGVARLDLTEKGMHAEVYSSTGLTPLGAAGLSLIRELFVTRYIARARRMPERLEALNQAVQQFFAKNGRPPSFRLQDGRYELYPMQQLPVPARRWIDPFSLNGRNFVYYAQGDRWIIASDGPDFDVDVRLPDDFNPGRNGERLLDDGETKRYAPSRGLFSDGDIYILGQFEKKSSP